MKEIVHPRKQSRRWLGIFACICAAQTARRQEEMTITHDVSMTILPRGLLLDSVHEDHIHSVTRASEQASSMAYKRQTDAERRASLAELAAMTRR